MEGGLFLNIDLLDELWSYAFNYVAFKQRIRLEQVSKRWQKIVRSPLTWHTVELGLIYISNKEALEKLECLLVQFCNGAIVDLNLDFVFFSREDQLEDQLEDQVLPLLNIIFSSKSLKRLALTNLPALTQLPVSSCKELKLLNIDTKLPDQAIFNLLSGLPNLEELYLTEAFADPEVAIPKNTLTRIQRLGFSSLSNDSPRSYVESVVEILPTLKYLIITEADLPSITQIKNTTVVVTSEAFEYPMGFEKFKQLTPILLPYGTFGGDEPLLSTFVRDYGIKDFVEYMVKELGYDLNTIYPMLVYRPQLIKIASGFNVFPIQVAIEAGNIELVKQLMALGATLECPDPERSFLRDAKIPEMRLFLLDNDVDPNKRVKIQNRHTGPAFLSWLLGGTDSREVATLLRDRVDIHTKLQNKSILYWTMYSGFWISFDVFLEAGVKLEASALRNLLFKDHNRFHKVMNSKSYYDDNCTTPISVGIKNVLYILTLRNANFPLSTKSTEGTELEQTSKYWIFEDKPSEKISNRYRGPNKAPSNQESSVTPKKERALAKPNGALPDLPSIDELTKILQASPPVEISSPEQSKTEETKPELKKQPSKEEIKPFDFKFDFGIENSLPKTPSDNLPQSNFSFNLPQFSTETSTSNNSFTFNLPKPTGFNFGDEPVVQPKPTIVTTSQINAATPLAQPSTLFAFSESVNTPVETAEEGSNETAFERTFNISYQNTIELMKDKINETTKRGSTALLCACRAVLYHKDKEFRIKALLANGADVNIADSHGWTPLHAVCYSGDWSLVELLINYGAKLDVQDVYGITPLAAAVYGLYFNSKPIPFYFQTALAKCSADVFKMAETVSKRGLVHLLAAVASPNEFLIIAPKCSPNVKDAMGYTPLHYAIYFGNMNLANFLLDNQADPNIQTKALKVTPAMLLLQLLTFATVSETGNYEYFRSQMTLFSCRPRMKISKTPFEYATTMRPPWHVSSRDHKSTQIRRTIKLTGAIETLGKLLEKSDPSLADGEGNTLLHLYLQYNLQAAYNFAATKPELWARKNNLGDTPFVMACRDKSFGIKQASGMLAIAKQAKIDLNEQDSQGYSPLYYVLNNPAVPMSVKQEWLTFVDEVSLDKQGLQKRTILEHCLYQPEFNSDLFVQLMAKQPELLLSRDNLGRPLLMQLLVLMREKDARTQQPLRTALYDVINHLVDAPTAINQQDNNGDTALHLACRYFHLGDIEAKCSNTPIAKFFFTIVTDLMAHGADATIKNKKGEAPTDYLPHMDNKDGYQIHVTRFY